MTDMDFTPEAGVMGTEAAGPGSGSGSGNNDTGGGIADDVAPVRRLSLPPGLSLRSCTPEDVPHLVDVYINAFSGGDFAYWWGSVPAMRTWNMERFLRRFRDPREAMFKIVANEASEESGKADDKGGEKGGERIVAHTRWVLPEGIKGSGLREERDFGGSGEGRQDVQEDKERKGDEHPDVPDGVDVELYREFFDGLTRAGEKWKANEKLELSLLFTDPAYHGRGIGAAAVRAGLEVADAEGIECFLDALPLAAPLYTRLGFEVVDRIDFPLARAHTGRNPFMYVMVRKPRGKRDETHEKAESVALDGQYACV